MTSKATIFNFSFPASVSAVTAFGTEKWADNFFMPVPRTTYFEIHADVSKAYGKSLKTLSPSAEPYWSWTTNHMTTYQIAEYAYTLLLIKKLREEGFESIFTSSDMKLDDAEKEIHKLLSFPVLSGKPGIYNLLVEKWRAIRTNWGGYRFPSYLLPSIFNSPLYTLGGKWDEEVRAYLKELGSEPVNLRPDLYIRNACSGNFTSEVETASRIFENEMSEIMKKYGFSLPKGYFQDLSRYMDGCAQMISGTRKNICGWARSELIINPVANLKHRIFASAWRLSGGTVTGLSHGAPYIYGAVHPDMVNGANSILDKLVTMSSEEKNLFEWSREKRNTGLRSQAEIHACKNTVYKDSFFIFNRGSVPKKIKKIMLMGAPLNDRLQLAYRLHLLIIEVELLSTLIKNNYHVIYKAHPDTLKQTEKLFIGSGCERVTDSFENVWDDSDCVLFPHVFSTAFGLSLMTPKHVIAFSWKDNSCWRAESLDKLKKRATILEVELGMDGKPVFDRNMLLDSLSSPKDFDHSIIHEFALK